MNEITYILICHFGLEKILKSEIKKLGLEVKEVTDGEIKALGNISDIPRLNYNLRTSERVMIELSSFKATTFEELFQGVLEIEIELDGTLLVWIADRSVDIVGLVIICDRLLEDTIAKLSKFHVV